MLKEPEVTLEQVPQNARQRMPAKWARGTRFYFCMKGVFARRDIEAAVYRWTGKTWVKCGTWPDEVPLDV